MMQLKNDISIQSYHYAAKIGFNTIWYVTETKKNHSDNSVKSRLHYKELRALRGYFGPRWG